MDYAMEYALMSEIYDDMTGYSEANETYVTGSILEAIGNAIAFIGKCLKQAALWIYNWIMENIFKKKKAAEPEGPAPDYGRAAREYNARKRALALPGPNQITPINKNDVVSLSSKVNTLAKIATASLDTVIGTAYALSNGTDPQKLDKDIETMRTNDDTLEKAKSSLQNQVDGINESASGAMKRDLIEVVGVNRNTFDKMAKDAKDLVKASEDLESQANSKKYEMQYGVTGNNVLKALAKQMNTASNGVVNALKYITNTKVAA